MVGNPLDGRVGEDEVVGAIRRERPDVPPLEPEAVARERRCPGQHRQGGVDADRLPCRQPPVHFPRQLARAAPQVDHAHTGAGLHQIEQVEKGLRPLVAEPLVLLGVPVGRGR